MTTIPGARPLPDIRRVALELMQTRHVVAVLIRQAGGKELFLYRQDATESDECSAKILRALRGEEA